MCYTLHFFHDCTHLEKKHDRCLIRNCTLPEMFSYWLDYCEVCTGRIYDLDTYSEAQKSARRTIAFRWESSNILRLLCIAHEREESVFKELRQLRHWITQQARLHSLTEMIVSNNPDPMLLNPRNQLVTTPEGINGRIVYLLRFNPSSFKDVSESRVDGELIIEPVSLQNLPVDERDCLICHDTATEPVVVLNCRCGKRVYCAECIYKHLSNPPAPRHHLNKHPSCPLCRNEFPTIPPGSVDPECLPIHTEYYAQLAQDEGHDLELHIPAPPQPIDTQLRKLRVLADQMNLEPSTMDHLPLTEQEASEAGLDPSYEVSLNSERLAVYHHRGLVLN